MFRRVYQVCLLVVASAGASLLPGPRGDIPDGPQGPPGAVLKVMSGHISNYTIVEVDRTNS